MFWGLSLITHLHENSRWIRVLAFMPMCSNLRELFAWNLHGNCTKWVRYLCFRGCWSWRAFTFFYYIIFCNILFLNRILDLILNFSNYIAILFLFNFFSALKKAVISLKLINMSFSFSFTFSFHSTLKIPTLQILKFWLGWHYFPRVLS